MSKSSASKRGKSGGGGRTSFPLLIAGGGVAALACGMILWSCRPASPPPSGNVGPAPVTESTQSVGGTLTQPAPQPSPASDTTATGPRQITVYKVTTDDSGSRLAPATVTLTGNGDAGTQAVAALNAMSRFGKDSPLPDGAQAKSVAFSGDTATVDFNDALTKNFSGGDEDEALVLNAITATLGQFPGVKQVQITVEGKKIDSLGGTQSLESPLPVPQTVNDDASPSSSPSPEGSPVPERGTDAAPPEGFGDRSVADASSADAVVSPDDHSPNDDGLSWRYDDHPRRRRHGRFARREWRDAVPDFARD